MVYLRAEFIFENKLDRLTELEKKLKEKQVQLEKMAALGSLMSGVVGTNLNLKMFN